MLPKEINRLDAGDILWHLNGDDADIARVKLLESWYGNAKARVAEDGDDEGETVFDRDLFPSRGDALEALCRRRREIAESAFAEYIRLMRRYRDAQRIMEEEESHD